MNSNPKSTKSEIRTRNFIKALRFIENFGLELEFDHFREKEDRESPRKSSFSRKKVRKVRYIVKDEVQGQILKSRKRKRLYHQESTNYCLIILLITG